MVQSIKNIIATIIISISVYLIWTITLPEYDYTSAIKVETQRRLDVLTKRQNIFQMVTNLQDTYQQRYAEFRRLALVVPAHKSLPEFVSTIEAMASESGIIITELKIEGGTSEEVFNIVNFEVNMNASYDAVFNFLSLLEQNIRLIDVNFLSIGTTPGETASSFLTTQIRARTYYLNPQIEPEENNQTNTVGGF
ncbi:MAG: hypothetical protein A3B86_00025 [Candidatus Yanofskybacteria bacterium RIFCSPHIGHO2_02_FULL_38_22b]|uniref:Pilus assembly protein PilO n=1 Tax=Candidatus Yanofskybacteria bacterium RIFCSPHIGHO2_02_FULL_38_22b TaxID=1802673 RepID=A0A1F8F1I4_9BACT|nr:MAG: hypothetical protein A2816_00965 [Candidatus Yanofskybacteria bacterium RIFCSPHIGHO2_01_FULL_39_44]OGN06983.1 MAG: hypothetical protein A3B86_00025 [Candidatus Yanofskybacteria bacterium RIFCSPHIGHO2_02_FULL_38_22b]